LALIGLLIGSNWPVDWQAMRRRWDVLTGRHSNFHEPLVVGTARRFELFQVYTKTQNNRPLPP
jgi:hypothetical protein